MLGGMGGGLMGTMATGMAFGAGSEIAHQGVRAMMGGGGGHGGQGGGEMQQQEPQGYAPQRYAQEQPMAAAPQEQTNPCMNYN